MINKVIIPAAGLGTRFLPITKSQAKEMLPVFDKPTIHRVLEEAINVGLDNICLVTSKGKTNLENYFDNNLELEIFNVKKEIREKLEKEFLLINKANIFYVRQKKPLGLANAVLTASAFIAKDELFAVFLADELLEVECLKKMIGFANEKKKTVIAVMKVEEKEELKNYGVVKLKSEFDAEGFALVDGFVEKPQDNFPSSYAIIGRYILPGKIFEIIENLKPGRNGEYQLTDAINILAKKDEVYVYNFRGKRFDVGNRLGWLYANIYYFLETASKEEKEKLKKLLSKHLSYFNFISGIM